MPLVGRGSTAVPHQPLLMRPRQCPETEQDHQDAASEAHLSFAQQGRQPLGGQSGGQQYRPGTEPKASISNPLCQASPWLADQSKVL